MPSYLWPSVAGGLLGTLVLSTVLRAASELGFTRMDLPFLLGTVVTSRRVRAKAWGFALHLTIGIVFAVAYGAIFVAIGQSGIVFGGVLGALHAVFSGTTLVNVLLPIVHPRMGTSDSSAAETPLIEPPGFLMLNYGRNTFVVMLAAHIVYGAIIGWAVSRALGTGF
jgi:hypothetical protein